MDIHSNHCHSVISPLNVDMDNTWLDAGITCGKNARWVRGHYKIQCYASWLLHQISSSFFGVCVGG